MELPENIQRQNARYERTVQAAYEESLRTNDAGDVGALRSFTLRHVTRTRFLSSIFENGLVVSSPISEEDREFLRQCLEEYAFSPTDRDYWEKFMLRMKPICLTPDKPEDRGAYGIPEKMRFLRRFLRDFIAGGGGMPHLGDVPENVRERCRAILGTYSWAWEDVPGSVAVLEVSGLVPEFQERVLRYSKQNGMAVRDVLGNCRKMDYQVQLERVPAEWVSVARLQDLDPSMTV